MIRLFVVVVCFFVALGGSDFKNQAFAEDPIESLKLELSILSSQVEDLRAALLSPEVRSLAPGDAGIALLRLDALEAKLRATVGRVEALEFNIEILSKDANHRIREFNLRLTELEGESQTLNNKLSFGKTKSSAPNDFQKQVSDETLSFDTALLNFKGDDFTTAIDNFKLFIKKYPSSINIPEAYYWLGLSQQAVGSYKFAANAFLDSFSLAPSGNFAWKSLLKLGEALGDLGQIEQACLTLSELKSRFPEKVDENLNKILSIEEPLECSPTN